MQGYSINGYLNAIRRRSAKTIMVEGTSDFSVLTRLKRAVGAASGQEPSGQIDVAGLLTDERLKGLGKREVLRLVLSEVTQLGIRNPDVVRKFGTLQDREWDGLDLDMRLNMPWHPPAQSLPHFVTSGHSIENYFFRVESVEAYLRFSFSDELQQNFFNDLTARFGKILTLAAVYSLAMRNLSSITKAGSLINRNCVIWDGANYIFTDELPRLLTQRKVAHPSTIVTELNSHVTASTLNPAYLDPTKWICHGHLGEEAIWSCVAHLAKVHTGRENVAQDVERGARESRFKHAVDHLSRSPSIEISPLQDAIEWVTSP